MSRFFALAMMAAAACAQSITTVAGNGNSGFSGDGGPATSAQLSFPTGITSDTAGSLYITEFGNNCVRKVAVNGTISTVAGKSGSGFSGDGGPATNALFSSPQGVAVDAAGNLYISDTLNNRIRKVAPNGIVSTFAGKQGSGFSGDGGLATNALLSAPQDLTIDASGNLFFVDSDNFRIRRVTSAGIISTVAGNGSPGSSGDGGAATSAGMNPSGVAKDAAGNLYIAENSRVRKVTPAGTITTFAGTASGGFSGDGGPAANAALSGPRRVTLDASGNVYIADSGNQRIRKVTPNGTIGTVAGNGHQAFSGDGGPATAAGFDPIGVSVDTAGNLYIADNNNHRVRKVTLSGTAGTGALQTVSGNNQSTTAGQLFAASLVVKLVDGQNNPTGGANVAWAVTSGSATLSAMTVTTDSSGTASVRVTAGASAGAVTVRASSGSLTADFSLFVTAVTSPVTLTSSLNPSVYLQNVTLTATVSIQNASGNVTFRDGSTILGASLLNSTRATFNVSTLTAGTHSLTASFGSNNPMTSAVLSQVVTQATTKTTLSPSVNPSTTGQSVTLTATVSSSSATGRVTFMDGSSAVGGATATLTVDTLTSGTHSLTAVYGGDGNYAGSTSAILNQVVNGSSTVGSCAPTFSYAVGNETPAPIACQFTSNVSGSFTVSTTTPWLQVSPSSGTLGIAPALLSISVNPTGMTASSYSGSFTIAGPQIGSLTIPVQLTVTGQPSLIATPSSLFFTYQQGSFAPAAQSLTISSTDGTQLPFGVTASGGTWLFTGVNGGIAPEPFNIAVFPIGLAPNAYTGTLTVSSPGVPSITVNVSLTVTTPIPPKLSITAPPPKLSGLRGGSVVTTRVDVANAGGGILNFTASTSGGDWLSVSPASGTVDNTASGSATPLSLSITSDPTLLSPGTYQGSVTVIAGDDTNTIPVIFSVADPRPVILVSQSGLSFTAVAQGGAPMPQQIGVLNIGSGSLDWTGSVSTLSGGNWLMISTPAGTVPQPFLDVSLANVAVDPAVVASLAPGDYYGNIQVDGPAVNTPQLVTVILTVLPPGADPGPELHPASLIFTGQAGASPDPQNVSIGIRKAAGDAFKSGHTLGLFPYSYTPGTSPVQPNQPVSMQVMPDFSQLTPGVPERDTITIQFNDGTARNISLLSVVAPPPDAPGIRLRASCNGAVLNLQWRTPATPNFVVVVGRGQTLELQVVDSCGNLVGPSDPRSASVHAIFSNKDPDLALVHVGNGIWTGTWKPINNSAAPVLLTATAFNSSGQVLQNGQTSSLSAAVVSGNTPLVTAGGVQHGASFVLGAPIAPGTLVTLKGLNLANADSATSEVPLPTLWNGTRVFLGTEALPLLYTASGQVNVQVPFDVPVNTQYQVTVQRENVKSLPEQLVVAEAQPGIFTADASGSGQGVIFRGVTLAQPGSPASAGETVTIECTGLGVVTPEVPAGTPAPDSPVSSTVNSVAVTIGGVDAQATVGTLIPGRPGLYSVTAIVPVGVSGDAVPVVVTVAGQTSPAVTMAVQ